MIGSVQSEKIQLQYLHPKSVVGTDNSKILVLLKFNSVKRKSLKKTVQTPHLPIGISQEYYNIF